MRSTLLLLGLLGLASADGRKDPRVMAEGKAPTPFTARQLREASPDGRVSLVRLKSARGTVLVRFSFGKCDEESTTLESAGLTLEKKPIQPPTTRAVKWTELQAHASFDESATTITEEVVTVEFGKFDCWVYLVKRGEELHRFCFAKVLPGPPILLTVKKGDETTQSMELVEHRCFDYAKVFGSQERGAAPAVDADWKAVASVRSPQSGPLKLVASLKGSRLPHACRLEVAAGPLKGAIVSLHRDAETVVMTCDHPLPAGFRMTPGELEVKVVAVEQAK